MPTQELPSRSEQLRNNKAAAFVVEILTQKGIPTSREGDTWKHEGELDEFLKGHLSVELAMVHRDTVTDRDLICLGLAFPQLDGVGREAIQSRMTVREYVGKTLSERKDSRRWYELTEDEFRAIVPFCF